MLWLLLHKIRIKICLGLGPESDLETVDEEPLRGCVTAKFNLLLFFMIYYYKYYLPAGRSVLGKTAPEVLFGWL